MSSVLFLCTGNAARSVMAGVALARLRPDIHIETAGTLTVDGLPISWRTRAALDAVGLPWPTHASKQATNRHLLAADVVIGLAPEHVEWVRRHHRRVADRTTTLLHLVSSLTLSSNDLSTRISELGLEDRRLEPWEEVVDPGGGEVEVFISCAHQVVELVDRLAGLL